MHLLVRMHRQVWASVLPRDGTGSCPVGRNKLAQFRQLYGKRTVAMPELRKLVPAYKLTIYRACIRMAPSSRMVLPLIIGFSTIC